MNVEVESPTELISKIKYEFDDPDKEGESLFTHEQEGGKVTLRASSLVQLISIITNNQRKGLKEVDVMDNIITTFRAFTTPINILNYIIKRFNGPPPLPQDPTPTELKQHELFKSRGNTIQST